MITRQWETPLATQSNIEINPRTYKIRQHDNGTFDCISYNFWGRRLTYGHFKNLADAVQSAYVQDGIKPEEWELTKGKHLPQLRIPSNLQVKLQTIPVKAYGKTYNAFTILSKLNDREIAQLFEDVAEGFIQEGRLSTGEEHD